MIGVILALSLSVSADGYDTVRMLRKFNTEAQCNMFLRRERVKNRTVKYLCVREEEYNTVREKFK